MLRLCLISTAEAGLFESQNIFRGFCWVCSFCLHEDVCLLSGTHSMDMLCFPKSLPDVRMHNATHLHSSSQQLHASTERWFLKAGQGFHRENQSSQMHCKTAKMWPSERKSSAMAEAVQNTQISSQSSLSHFLSPLPLPLCCQDICQQNGNDTVPGEK